PGYRQEYRAPEPYLRPSLHHRTRPHRVERLVGAIDGGAGPAAPLSRDLRPLSIRSSCPALGRASTSSLQQSKKAVDGRDEHGHDESLFQMLRLITSRTECSADIPSAPGCDNARAPFR